MGDDDVAGREPLDLAADLEHLAHRRVAGIDATTPQLGDVHRVGQGGMTDVVLGRDGEDAQVDIAGPEVGKLDLVELDHPGDVHLLGVATDPLALAGHRLGGDAPGADCSRHGWKR